MKLLTLNCHSWQEDDQLEKINYLAETIKENDYDVIALQEVSQHMLGKPYKGQLKTDNYAIVLLEALDKLGVSNYEIVWDFAHIGFQVYEEGLCLLCKHPIIERESFFVTRSEDTLNWKTRRIVRATIRYHEEEIDLYSCHLGWWQDHEEPCKLQIDKLNEHLSNERLSLLMGDFNNNANTIGEGYSYMKELGWLDTYELAADKDTGETVQGKIAGWESNSDNIRVDYVWANRSVKVESSYVIFNGVNRKVISDHYGIEVVVKTNS